MKRILFPILTLALLSSCSDDSAKVTAKSGNSVSTIDADKDLPEDLRKELEELQKDEEARQRKLEATWTTLEFDKIMHDFGDVKADTDAITEFIVKNTGKNPLIIENVSASCGCTMPKKPEKPIPPGGSDVIEVKFHSKPGQLNEVNKTVTVTANTKDRIHEVKIRAFVKE
jgi:hypothetical protein